MHAKETNNRELTKQIQRLKVVCRKPIALSVKLRIREPNRKDLDANDLACGTCSQR